MWHVIKCDKRSKSCCHLLPQASTPPERKKRLCILYISVTLAWLHATHKNTTGYIWFRRDIHPLINLNAISGGIQQQHAHWHYTNILNNMNRGRNAVYILNNKTRQLLSIELISRVSAAPLMLWSPCILLNEFALKLLMPAFHLAVMF